MASKEGESRVLRDIKSGFEEFAAQYEQRAEATDQIGRCADHSGHRIAPGVRPVVEQAVAELVTPLILAELLHHRRATKVVDRRANSKQQRGHEQDQGLAWNRLTLNSGEHQFR